LLSEKLSWGEVTAMVILNEQYEDADFHLGTTHAVSLGRSREPSAHPKIYLAGRQSADSAAFDPDFRALEWCVASRYTVAAFGTLWDTVSTVNIHADSRFSLLSGNSLPTAVPSSRS